MENKNVVLTSPLAGEDARRAGEGDIKEKSYFPPSSVCSDFVRQTTSPARGEVKQCGFTLIELLVVVLIIGILAAVALPKYQVAVAKARLGAVMSQVKSLKQAAESYYLANGKYENDMSVLDIQFADCDPTQNYWCKTPKIIFDIWTSSARQWDVNATLYDDGVVMNCYGMYLDHSNHPGVKYCGARANSTVANQVCKSLGGTTYTVSNCLSSPPANQACNIYELP